MMCPAPTFLSTLFLDLNSYFASCEQQLNPELRGRPVGVVPMITDSTVCLAASYEAKKFGVKTGTNVGDARRMCPGIVFVRAQHEHYIRLHHEVVRAVESCVPVRAVHSIDEMSCRLVDSEREVGNALSIAQRIKERIARDVGECLKCSIGIAPNRFLAKVATDMQKPDGLVVIGRNELPARLYVLTLRDLPGVGPRMEKRLRSAGVETVQDLCRRGKEDLVRIWNGVLGEYFHAWLRGEETWEPPTRHRSVGHQHVLGPEYRNEADARSVALRLAHKAAVRARQMGYWVGRVALSVRYTTGRHWGGSQSLGHCLDTTEITARVAGLWDQKPSGSGLEQGEHGRARRGWPGSNYSTRAGPAAPMYVSVTLDDLTPEQCTPMPLFEAERRRLRLCDAMDRVNSRFGAVTIRSAAMHKATRLGGPRIAFSSVPDLDHLT